MSKQENNWQLIAMGLLILACLFLVSPREIAGAERPYRIGFTVPLTGAFGKNGSLVKDAYLFWQETINAHGGIEVKKKRYPVEMIYYDDKSEPQSSAKLVEKLITEDKVDLLLGGFGSSQVIAASAVSEKFRYPMTCGAASTLKLFDRGFQYFFPFWARLLENEHIKKFYLAL